MPGPRHTEGIRLDEEHARKACTGSYPWVFESPAFRSRPHRSMGEDGSLSRSRAGFESLWGYKGDLRPRATQTAQLGSVRCTGGQATLFMRLWGKWSDPPPSQGGVLRVRVPLAVRKASRSPNASTPGQAGGNRGRHSDRLHSEVG